MDTKNFASTGQGTVEEFFEAAMSEGGIENLVTTNDPITETEDFEKNAL